MRLLGWGCWCGRRLVFLGIYGVSDNPRTSSLSRYSLHSSLVYGQITAHMPAMWALQSVQRVIKMVFS